MCSLAIFAERQRYYSDHRIPDVTIQNFARAGLQKFGIIAEDGWCISNIEGPYIRLGHANLPLSLLATIDTNGSLVGHVGNYPNPRRLQVLGDGVQIASMMNALAPLPDTPREAQLPF